MNCDSHSPKRNSSVEPIYCSVQILEELLWLYLSVIAAVCDVIKLFVFFESFQAPLSMQQVCQTQISYRWLVV